MYNMMARLYQNVCYNVTGLRNEKEQSYKKLKLCLYTQVKIMGEEIVPINVRRQSTSSFLFLIATVVSSASFTFS